MDQTLAEQQPSSPFCRLPEDILKCIFDLLPVWELHEALPDATRRSVNGAVCKESVRCLEGLAYSCRGLYTIAAPALYKTLVGDHHSEWIRTTDDLHGRQSQAPESDGRFQKLLRTLIERPQLAESVKTLIIMPWSINALADYSLPESDLQKAYRRHVPHLLPMECQSRQSTIIQDLCYGDQDAEVALLLALVPNMNHLQLAQPPDPIDQHFSPWLRRVFDLATDSSSDSQCRRCNRFTQLRRVTALQTFPNHPADWMPELLRIPSLECLDGYFGFRKLYTQAPVVFNVGSSNVVSLTMLETMVESCDSFYNFMTSFRALRKFDLLLTPESRRSGWPNERMALAIYGQTNPMPNEPLRINRVGLLRMLSSQITTLKTVSIRSAFDPWCEHYRSHKPAKAVAFRGFKALRKLSILQRLLLPHDFVPNLHDRNLTDISTDTLFAALPFSIEEVEITHCFILVMWKHLHYLLDHVALFHSDIRKITTVSGKDHEKCYAQLFSMREHQIEMVDQGNGQADVEGREGNSASTDSPEDQGGIDNSADSQNIDGQTAEEIEETLWYNEAGDLLCTAHEERDRHFMTFLNREYRELAQRFEDAGIEWIWK